MGRPPSTLTIEALKQRTIVDDKGCWIWQQYCDKDGYGTYGYKYGVYRAHRVMAYIMWGNPLNKGLQVCHHCDEPACVNPQHLFLGSQSDNINDAVRKGRIPAGENHMWATKLNEFKVNVIRQLLKAGWLQIDVAKLFKVSNTHICDIVHKRTWKHVK